MFKVLAVRRVITILVLACFIVATVGSAALGGEKASKIELKTKFLKGLQFSLDGSKGSGIYSFTGFSHTQEFKDAMSSCPIALKETRKAFVYNGLQMAGTIGMLALVVKDLIRTIKDAQDVNSGIKVDDSFKVGDFVMIGTAGLVTITAGLLGKRRLKNGVRMFNEGCVGYLTPLTPREHGNAFGARFGFNSASVSGAGSITGLVFCFYQPIAVSEIVTLQPEYAVTQKGASSAVIRRDHYPYSELIYPGGSHWYLEIPFLVKVSPIDSKFRPSFFVGPAGALRIATTDGEEASGSNQKYKTLDYSWVVGASILIPNGNFSVDARYTKGLTKVIEGKDAKNKVFSLTFGAHF